jgi:integrase
LAASFGSLSASELTTDQAQQYRIKRTREGAMPATINREMHIIRRAYKIALRNTPPKVTAVPYLGFVHEDNARKSFITAEQLEKIKTAANHHSLWARTLVEMAYIFGWRLSEMLGLRVRNINLVEGTVRLETSKNGDAREVPMTDGLRALVAQLVRDKNSDEHLFVSHSQFKAAWKTIKTTAGVEVEYFHDYRRTSARSKRAAGIDEGTIMEIQGWKTAAMFRRYAIVDLENKRQALRKLSA